MKSLGHYSKAIKIRTNLLLIKIKYIFIYQYLRDKIHIKSKEETIKEIIKNKLSVSRFGDGEFELIFGNNLGFQKFDKKLSSLLVETLKSNDNNLLLCVNQVMFKNLLWSDTGISRAYKRILVNNLNFFKHDFNFSITYGEASFTRFYMYNKDKKHIENYINCVKKIWNNRNLIIVEGALSRLGVGNDLFSNTKSIRRILCPVKDAFSSYNEILTSTIENSKSDDLVLIALGPTATVLAYDLSKKGIQSIDIGHLDVEYMWFLNQSKERVPLQGKYVNEASEKFTEDFPETILKDFKSQVIKKIN